MKTFCLFAIFCVIALAQISFSKGAYENWSDIEFYINEIGAPHGLRIATCIKESIDANGAWHGSDEKIIKGILSEIAECIATPGNDGYDIVLLIYIFVSIMKFH